MRRWMALLVGLMLALAAAPAGAVTKPPAPVRLQVPGSGKAGTNGAPGTIWVGATPPGWNPATRPVIVFVQGLNGRAENWWTDSVYYGHNDMYDYAYSNGYQTAFVDLYDSGGSPGSMWANGQLLASQLQTIANYFGVNKLNIVAHSKGGIDANAAIVHYGAAPLVGRVVTLGSPHWGSPLADIAYSDWAGWLAELLGDRNDGVYVLQTGYMEYFRSVTDNRPEDQSVSYLTGAGTRWGPFPSALWLGGLVLSAWDENDGLVPHYSARKPGGTEIFVRDVDHDQIRVGRYTWNLFEPYLRSTQPASAAEPVLSLDSTGGPATQSQQLILRGGSGTAVAEAVPVESGVSQVTFQLLTSHPNLTAWVISPTGQRYDLRYQGQASYLEVMKAAHAFSVQVQSPPAGTWTLHIQASSSVAYLVQTVLNGAGATAALSTGGIQTPGQAGTFRLDLSPGARQGKLQVRATVRPVFRKGTGEAVPLTFAADSRGFSARPVFSEPGIFLVQVTVSGTLADGSPFERTLVKTVSVAGPGDRSPEHLQSLGR